MRTVLAVLVLAATAVVVLALGAPPLAWELMLVTALLVVTWRRWPRDPPRHPALFGSDPRWRIGSKGGLGLVELEVMGAVSAELGTATMVRRRLVGLVSHRASLTGPPSDDEGRRLVGEEAWSILTADGPLTPAELETLVGRIERL